ncbi:MAG: DUF4417 domain-containing protein [Planctomycetia bacterium]|nr:DUF4417 domain-containing protein [Planctomycetia bacterium]
MPSKESTPRRGCADIWNAFMVRDAKFCGEDEIPFCPSTLTQIPSRLLGYDQIGSIFDSRALVHCYLDDQKFDGSGGLWHSPHDNLKRLKKFAGVITPDFSTYQDMPQALKIFSTYKMRALGYWLTQQGVPVVNNVRWGDPDTYRYSFAGLPANSVLAVGTHGCIKRKENHFRFERGLEKMVEKLTPHTILVYGSTGLPIFQWLREQKVTIVEYPSKISIAMAGRRQCDE